jgi:hypothetical protein
MRRWYSLLALQVGDFCGANLKRVHLVVDNVVVVVVVVVFVVHVDGVRICL